MTTIIIPVFLQVLLTFILLFTVGYLRFRSVGQRTVNPKDYELMVGQDQWPVMMQRIGRSFHNQLELPVLFYVLALMVLVTDTQAQLLLTLSWVYVGLRYIHAIIHIAYNNVLHRFSVFVLSTLVLLAMWVLFFFEMNSKF
ncbi:MAPEG family protein [Marinicella sp. S1101]|uniref:MAPEG family protein n=1 Tax=Marinicella marina TaxID=2996016 RepID=UPI002260C064|nr:MAPEG family protein [Marinicella marina]MCX7554602.1 MAPEG family protein [Marinicella marina]MDJ1141014.1 MAPEG family protein [Marinicella marina]